ncbi:autotransporter domain-containing protein [Sodalis sp. dw_96]|uniref:porin n=1 Tax=Sodalis sp. dw_96 TaxID=2719794 RepID=UPI001BD221E2|nr:autotransporter domain-containing protein [Sodalis sp. dw_96]
MAMSLKPLALGVVASVLFGCASFAAQAEITLLKQDPQAGDPLSRLNFQVGGSIRPQFNSETTSVDKGSFKRNGFDSASRFRFSANYYLFDDISWISYYELGVNIPAIFAWKDHYAKGATDTVRRQLYTGFKSKTYGQLTFGQQNSVYYDVVGVKTDIWDDDMLAQAPNNGISGDYDGSYHARKQLKYKKSLGDTDLYAAYLFSDNDYLPGNGLRYQRKGGGSAGVDYHFTPDLTWGLAYNYTQATMKDPATHGSADYHQDITGTALSWKPGNWTAAVGGGWYHNFLTTGIKKSDDYFADNAYGTEYFLGYTFPIGHYNVKTLKPYFMGDRLKYVSGRNYQRHDNGVGLSAQLDYGFRADYEHVFTTVTGSSYGMNLIRLWYDF